MLDYADTANTSGSFPAVVSQNASAVGAGDGTPYNKDFIDDLWGANQALMSRAGLVPDGVPESASASQRMSALMRVLGYPGEVVMWGSASDPASLGIRLLMLEGGTVLCADYPDLVTATWVGATDNNANHALGAGFVKTSDSAGTTPSTTGLYFKIPDCRGMFPRGLDTAGTHDPDGTHRRIGNRQMDMAVKHSHEVIAQGMPGVFYSLMLKNDCVLNGTGDHYGGDGEGGTSAFEGTEDSMATTESRQSDYHASIPTYLVGEETRPKNFAIRFAVRY